MDEQQEDQEQPDELPEQREGPEGTAPASLTDEERIAIAIGKDDGAFDAVFPDLKDKFITTLAPAFPALTRAIQSFSAAKAQSSSDAKDFVNHMLAWNLLWDACNSLIAAFVLVRKGYQTEALAVNRLVIERIACAVVFFDNPSIANEFREGTFNPSRAIGPAGRSVSELAWAWGMMSELGSHVGKDNVGTSRMGRQEEGALRMAIGGHLRTSDRDREAIRNFVGDLCDLARCLTLAPDTVFFSDNRIKATLDGKSSRNAGKKS